MDLTIDRDALTAALARAERAADKAGTTVLRAATDPAGALTVEATDLDISLRERVPSTVDEPGAIGVPAKALREIVRAQAAGEVRLTVAAGTLALEIRSGRARSKLAGLDPDQQYAVPPPPDHYSTETPRAALVAALGRVGYCMCGDDTRPSLCGLNLAAGRVAATDGHRLASTTLPGDLGRGILPARIVRDLDRLLPACETVAWDLSDSVLSLRAGAVDVSARLIDGVFPDFNRVLPKSHSCTVRVASEALLRALGRVAMAADAKTAGGVRIRVDADALHLRASDGQRGCESDEDVEAEVSGKITIGGAGASPKPLEIGMSAHYLRQAVEGLSATTVELWMTDDLSPVRIMAGDESEIVIVMPMRL